MAPDGVAKGGLDVGQRVREVVPEEPAQHDGLLSGADPRTRTPEPHQQVDVLPDGKRLVEAAEASRGLSLREDRSPMEAVLLRWPGRHPCRHRDTGHVDDL